jgi:WD40 repeat protein
VTIGSKGTQLAYQKPSFEGAIEIRDVATNRVHEHDLKGPFAIAANAPVVAGISGNAVRVIDLMKKTHSDIAIEQAVTSVELSADGTRAVLMFATRDPEVWDVTSTTKLLTLAGARSAVLSEDGHKALGWTKAGEPLVVWDVDSHKAGVKLPTQQSFTVIGFAQMGTRIAVREGSAVVGDVQLWDATTGTLVAQRPDTSTITTFAPTRTWLTTIDVDHAVTMWSTADGTARPSFLGEGLMQVQANPQGTLVAGIAEYGVVAVLMSAADGRILARWPLEHSNPAISSTGFDPPKDGSAVWTYDGSAVITRSATVAVWPVANRYSAKQMAQLVSRNVLWHVKHGQLAWIRNAKLHGTVMRAGAPQANVELVVEVRTPPDIGSAPISWESSKKRVSTFKLTTDALGEFSRENLLPGEYTLTVANQTITAYVSAEDEPIVIELSSP